MTNEQKTKINQLIQLAEESIKKGSASTFGADLSLKQAELYMQLAMLVKEI